MLKNYFATAFRNLSKHRLFSLLNIAGLALGLAAFLLIALYIADELSFDRFHDKANSIYRVAQTAKWDGGQFRLAPTPAPMGPALKNDYPAVEQFVRIDAEGGSMVQYRDKKILADDMIFADPSFFTIFSFPLISGSASDALAKPGSIVITRSLAEKLFGDASTALHQALTVGDQETELITGVMQDPPANSHLRFSAVRAMPQNIQGSWDNAYLYTYLLLKPGANVQALQKSLPGFYEKYIRKEGEKADYHILLQPLTSIHLHSDLDYEISPNNKIQNIYLFSAIALLILAIASINYMNLSTARSATRVKEIGVRKVIGSGLGQLRMMFLAESVFITLVSGALALLLARLAIPAFNTLAGKELSIWRFGLPLTLSVLAGFLVLIGLISGLYPAFYLSRFPVISALKGRMTNPFSAILLRKSLVTVQFVVTIALIAGALVIAAQMHYVNTRSLGFNKDQVITFHLSDRQLRTQIPALKEKLLQNPLVEAVAAASNPIGNNNIGTNAFFLEQPDGQIQLTPAMIQTFMVDEDYIPAMQIQLAKGRNFSKDFPSDQQHSVLVNETLVQRMGWTNPIGKKLQQFSDAEGHKTESVIVGVVKDFNIYSLQHKIEPLVLKMPPVDMEKDNLYVRLSKRNIAAGAAYVGQVFKSFDPKNPFEFRFLDQNFAAQYESEQKQGKIVILFTALAIAIACLGLFGLVSFSAEQRTKEIGIRKVLGASVGSLVALIARDFLKLVLVAAVIAIPLAWLVMSKWLENFYYRISISWWVFAVAGGAAFVFALITVCIKAIRSALTNPVVSLKAE